MTGSAENRRHPRVKLKGRLHIAWQLATGRWVSFADSLSLGGVFIATRETPSVGAAVRLLLELPGGYVRARGDIRHLQPGRGLGIKIVSMSQEDRARLRAYLQTAVA